MACGCEIEERLCVNVNPCSAGVELPIVALFSGSASVVITFNGVAIDFDVMVEEGEKVVIPRTAVNEAYTHKMGIFGLCYELVTRPVQGGGTFTPTPPASGNAWQWGALAASGSTVTSTLLTGELAPILWINEQPVDWSAQGIIWDSTAGTLDFSSYVGVVNGTIYIQYRNL